MSIYAIGDLHLGNNVDKPMNVFGELWENHPERIRENWLQSIGPEDLVLIPGDISWAMTLDQAESDLTWIASLPGTKVMIRGNHDYWWNGIGKVRKALTGDLYAIQNDAMAFHGYAICGTRGWVLPSHPMFSPDDELIFKRELERLRLSLTAARKLDLPILAMLHYPPTSNAGEDTPFTNLLDEFEATVCIYGHLHGNAQRFAFNGEKGKTRYQLASADYINFRPIIIS